MLGNMTPELDSQVDTPVRIDHHSAHPDRLVVEPNN